MWRLITPLASESSWSGGFTPDAKVNADPVNVYTCSTAYQNGTRASRVFQVGTSNRGVMMYDAETSSNVLFLFFLLVGRLQSPCMERQIQMVRIRSAAYWNSVTTPSSRQAVRQR
jgi:hypothetical protein